MYKIIIVHNEPETIKDIIDSVPWEKWGCQVIATAHDGLDGKEIVRLHKPNILFTDILLPGLDGLSMVDSLKSEFEDMEICFLCECRDFDFAQRAIRVGVTRLLLKPFTVEDLEEATKAMVENLQKKKIKPADGDRGENGREELGSFVVKNALKYIEEHYDEKLTLGEVAENTFVSQWHLSKLLNGHTKQNFSTLLNEVRIEKAKELLRDPSLRIGDVARKVGFSDSAHFSRVFRRMCGMSANEFRKHLD